MINRDVESAASELVLSLPWRFNEDLERGPDDDDDFDDEDADDEDADDGDEEDLLDPDD
ncbi:MAG TPA: hypothetical protein VI299_10110 [Polyangiales bacterium]